MTHFRPPLPKPTRLNHVALVAIGALAFVTILAVLWWASSRTRAPGGDPPVAAQRTVVPQHPSYPTDTFARVEPEATPASRVAAAAAPALAPALAALPSRARSSALMVPSLSAGTRTDTVPPFAPSQYMLLSGTMISASLVTEIHSTLPGLVIAQVERDVYDTPTMRWVLIPRGARLIGRYDSKVAQGEDALSVVWTRVMFPNGQTMSLPDFESADAAGTSGLRGAVNSHLGRAYLDAGVMSVVGAGAQLSQAPASVPYGVASPGQAIAGSVGQQMTEQSLETLRNDAHMTPVITVRGGTSFLVVVTRDVAFDRPY